MRIGLIADTHLPALGREPPPEVARAFAGVDLILHAGDIYSSDCLDSLELIAPVIAVEVPPAPVIGDPRVLEKRVLSLEGHSVGLVHDLFVKGLKGGEVIPGVMAAKFPPDGSLSADLEDFFGEPVDTVVFGHTHIPLAETYQGVLLVNPGSPTLPRQIRKLGNVAIMELTPEDRSIEIVDLATLDA